MEPLLLLKAMLIGLSIAAPVGPIGLLCIQRTLNRGFAAGLVTGLGAASADALYGALGALGLGGIGRLLDQLAQPLAIAGSLFLALLGLHLLRSRPDGEVAANGGGSVVGAYLSTLLLTLANPATILTFIAVFASLSGDRVLQPATAGLLISGVFLGSAAWWLLLAGSVARIRHRVSARAIARIGQVAGLLLIVLATWQFWTLVPG